MVDILCILFKCLKLGFHLKKMLKLTQLILGRPYKGLILNMLNVPYDGPILIFEKLSFQIE